MYVDPQEFGELKGKVEAIKERLDSNTSKIDEIHEYVTKQKGAAATIHILWVAITAAIATAISYFK
jgi:tetrahydromethanopterin S-methyltransferase subunit G